MIHHRLGAWLRVVRCAALAAVALAAKEPRGQSSPTREYQVKAVFLFNFAQFVEWPANAFAEPQTPLVIGILGDDPFGPYLDEAVRGETVNNHPLVVQRYRRAEDITTCHILFISTSEDAHLGQVLDDLKGRNILTVGEGDRFAVRGGMIRFIMDHNRVRLRINLEATEAANLKLSSKLLRPAEIVGPEKP